MIAIITARGGSKRIPKKNIKEFFGKPIIAYSIEAALSSNLFEIVMVSTDDVEIKEVSLKYGAEVPFMRSEKNSNDMATTRDVLLEVIDKYKSYGILFDKFACIYPTAPFLTSKILKEAYNKFILEDSNALVPIVKYSFPPQRAFILDNAYVKAFDEKLFPLRSQDLKPLYHDCGQFYFYKTEEFVSSKKNIIDKTTYIEIEENFVQDIDSIKDWEIAELKYRIINGN